MGEAGVEFRGRNVERVSVYCFQNGEERDREYKF